MSAPTPRRAVRRRTLFGAAAGVSAGALGVWGASRFVDADPVDPKAAEWRQEIEAGVDSQYRKVHELMREFMEANKIRAGQVSARLKNSVHDELRISAGYTFAEPGFPTVKPDSLFRVASISKAFTCAAIYELSQAGVIDLSEPVFPYLGITKEALPSQTKDPKVDTITIQHLVDHTGGWDNYAADFEMFWETRKIALDLELPGRVGKRDVAEYMYGEPLQHAPGEKEVYCNFGYLLLGMVVEKATGSSFYEFLKTDILTPLGIEDEVHLGATLKADALPGEVEYDAEGTASSAWDPHSDEPVPIPYGHFLVSEMDSTGGLVATARATSRLISHYAAWGLGERVKNTTRFGSMYGTRSVIRSNTSIVNWSYTFNNQIDDKRMEQLNEELDITIARAMGG